MKYLYIFFLFFLISCGYDDIDSVPTFENLKIYKNESMDLCNLTYIDNTKELSECLENIE
jgi:hypothetical protein